MSVTTRGPDVCEGQRTRCVEEVPLGVENYWEMMVQRPLQLRRMVLGAQVGVSQLAATAATGTAQTATACGEDAVRRAFLVFFDRKQSTVSVVVVFELSKADWDNQL